MARFLVVFILLFFSLEGFALESKTSSFYCPHGCHSWFSEKTRETERLFMNALREATYIGDYAYYFYQTRRETISLEDRFDIQNKSLPGIWPLRMERDGLLVFSSVPQAYWFIETEEKGGIEGYLFCRECFSDPDQDNAYALSQYVDMINITDDLEKDVIRMIESLPADKARDFLKSKRFPYFQDLLHTSINHFRKIHQTCAANHEAPLAFLHEALMYLNEGDHLRALEQIDEIYKRIDMKTFEDAALASTIGLSKGEVQNQLAYYLEGMQTLGLAIERYPNNRKAHLEQAIAHFEMGDFEKSLASFSEMQQSVTPIHFEDVLSLEFATGLIKGITLGGCVNLIEFVPSMLSSIRGLSFGLWAFVSDPIQVSKELISASQKVIELIQTNDMVDLCQVVIPEIKELRNPQLCAERKGELFGQIIGRFGTDFLLFAGVSKGMTLYKDLRHANAALTLEKMTKDLAKKEALTKISNDWWKKTSSVIKDIKMQDGRIGDNLYRAFRREGLSELQVRKILHQAGFKTLPRPKRIPSNSTVQISKKNGGMVYIKAGTTENQCMLVRVMPGNPNSPNPMQRKPYVVQRRGKEAVSKSGKFVDFRTPEAHIPLEEFDFKGW